MATPVWAGRSVEDGPAAAAEAAGRAVLPEVDSAALAAAVEASAAAGPDRAGNTHANEGIPQPARPRSHCRSDQGRGSEDFRTDSGLRPTRRTRGRPGSRGAE